jgi:putative phosphoesterase
VSGGTPECPFVDLTGAARIGVISDTHGLVRPELYAHLEGVDAILHGGDLGSDMIDVELSPIAPFYAVAGNVDGFSASEHPMRRLFRVGDQMIGMTHVGVKGRNLLPSVATWVESERIDVLIFGHTHVPLIESDGSLTRFNPGSCGPRRFSLPVSMGVLDVADRRAIPVLIDLG